jgi:hypothetical protein
MALQVHILRNMVEYQRKRITSLGEEQRVMSKEPLEQNLPNRVRHIASSEARDHIVNIIKAGINAVPGVGGVISSLIDDYIPKVKEERLRKLLENLSKDAQTLGEKLSQVQEGYVHTEEYAFLFERCFKNAMENYHEEKLRAYRAIMLNSLLPDAPDEDRKIFYLALAEALTPLHIRVLRVLGDPVSFDMATGNRVGTGGGLATSRMAIMRKLFPEYPEELLESIWNDLRLRELIGVGDLRTTITDKGIHQMEGLLTTLGNQFIRFITLQTR